MCGERGWPRKDGGADACLLGFRSRSAGERCRMWRKMMASRSLSYVGPNGAREGVGT